MQRDEQYLDTQVQVRLIQSQNCLQNCSGCHITSVRKVYTTPTGENVVNLYPASLVPENSANYPDLDGDGLPDMADIGCESCHEPGSAHIQGGGDATKIVNPDNIEAGPGGEWWDTTPVAAPAAQNWK